MILLTDQQIAERLQRAFGPDTTWRMVTGRDAVEVTVGGRLFPVIGFTRVVHVPAEQALDGLVTSIERQRAA